MDEPDFFPLDLLPLDIIEVVCKYLTAQEIASCCAVSHSMRKLFGSDSLWKPLCYKELAEYLSNTSCKVQPGFVSPEPKDTTLMTVSQWRMAFMRENHLWNNWRQGKYKREKIRNSDFPNDDPNSNDYNAKFHMFQTNDVVVALFQDKIKLLDVREYPAADATEPVQHPICPPVNVNLISCDDLLIIYFGTCVQVYKVDFSIRITSIQHFFFFQEQQKTIYTNSGQLMELFIKKTIPNHCVHLYTIAGTLFVGVLEEYSTMHIWDLKTGLKLKEEACPVKNCKVRDIKSSKTMKITLTASKNRCNTSILLVYDLIKLKFLQVKELNSGPSEIKILNDSVAIMCDNLLYVYDCESWEILLNAYQGQTPLQFVKNNFLFLREGVIQMFNPASKAIEPLNLSNVKWFDVMSNKFIQVDRNNKLEIWEFNQLCNRVRKHTSMDFPFRACWFFVNKACTRYIVRYAVGEILHFW